MNDLEIIFSMLGEAGSTEIARNNNAQGFGENKEAAKQGGDVAGKARKDLEGKSGKKVLSKHNYLNQPQNTKLFSASLFYFDLQKFFCNFFYKKS